MIEFDIARHEYREEDKTYPSVTQILKDCGIIDTTWYTDDSALRGTYVHDILKAIDEGELPIMLDISDDIAGYIDAYLKFIKENDFKAEAIEKPYINKKLNFAGTPDRIGRLNGKRCIVDIKTGGKERWHGLQLAGYNLLIDGSDLKLYGLYLKKDGKYKLENYKEREYRNIFIDCLNIYQWKRR